MQGNEDDAALTNTIARTISGAGKTESMSSACIYRVRNELRKLKKSAYTPQLVSIGPLHSNDKHIMKSPMEDIKKSYVDILFSRMKDEDSTIDTLSELQKCVKKMKQLLDKAKKYYLQVEKVNRPDENTEDEDDDEDKDAAKKCHEEKEKVDSLDVKMLVIDGCFILELLYRFHHKYGPNRDKTTQSSSNQNSNKETWTDFVFDSCQNRVTIRNDLLLLENQLPWFVLEALFCLTVAHLPIHLPLLSDYVLSYFDNMMYFTKREGCCKNRVGIEHIMHILHLLHGQFRPHDSFKEEGGACTKYWKCGPCSSSGQVPMLPPASELKHGGVKFKDGGSSNRTESGGGDHRFNVQFNYPDGPFCCFRSACFELPILLINESTEILWRNLIAFEQYYLGVALGYPYTSYAVLMDRLINTENDVQVLEKDGVLLNSLGDRKEASDLFNRLCKEIVLPENCYFAETCNKAANYSKRYWPTFTAYVKGKYFASPWTFIAFFVAFITFAMSVTQFIRGLLR